jgi:CRISPR-associated endonuclease/helicase Cas3
LEVWKDLNHIDLPNDIRSLIEKTYEDRIEGGSYNDLKKELQEEKNTMEHKALISTSTNGETFPDTSIDAETGRILGTRYSERITVGVLLVKSVVFNATQISLKMIDGAVLNLPRTIDKKNPQWKKDCNTIQENMVNVSEYEAPDSSDIEWLSDYVYIGKEKDLCRIGVVNKDYTISNQNGGKMSNYMLSYDPILGYVSSKIERKKA